ncbi:uncharacterized protein LOC134814426 [Bolinopsis microptera]|uniref:uncharacterized protein LOC134814426 n=1 Tax=Bolinopsis microptera TaxID=2820187 RepID=UPI00307AD4C2
MLQVARQLSILLLLTLGGSALPLLSSLKCLDENDGGEDCYSSFDEVAMDLQLFGMPIESVVRIRYGRAFDIRDNIPEPTKQLTLRILETAVEQETSLSKSAIGYLTKYGYVKGVLKVMKSCSDSDDTIRSAEILASVITFQRFTHATNVDIFIKMSHARCSVPDINFDSDGNLDEKSAEIILSAIEFEGTDNLKERVGEFRSSHESNRRRKRAATPKGTLDLSDKTEFTYNLINKPSGQSMPFANDGVDIAFESWSNAIGPAVTFIRTTSKNPDAKLEFVADEHNDYTFDGDELAHAPFPSSEYHGSVHYRANRVWDVSAEDKVDFIYVTVHELGHYLGLRHSSVDDSVMLSIFDSTTIPEDYNGGLHDSDILAVKLLFADQGPSNCPDDWHRFEGMCYIAHTMSAGITWDDAQTECEDIGAGLATVRNGPLNVYILATVANGRSPYWIGRKSSEDEWVSGESFDWFPEINKAKQMDPSSTRCLRATAYSGSAKWEFVHCANIKKAKTEHYVCEKREEDFKEVTTPTPTPTPEIVTQPNTVMPTFAPCQNYIRGAIRRGNFLYIFGNAKYFKYFYTNSRPTLQPGYPKDIADNFEGIPQSFSAVVTNPYDRKMIYFIDDQEVYEWKVRGKRSSIEDGKLKERGKKSGGKPKKLKSLFKTTNVLRGATVFDRNSIMLFAREEVGRWYRETISKSKMTFQSYYDTVDKWDYLDSMGSSPIDAVTPSYFEKFIMFIRKDEYFLVRKSDGKIPRKFIRNLSSDFDKLEICDVIAPFITEYPENIDPDLAILEEEE